MLVVVLCIIPTRGSFIYGAQQKKQRAETPRCTDYFDISAAISKTYRRYHPTGGIC